MITAAVVSLSGLVLLFSRLNVASYALAFALLWSIPMVLVDANIYVKSVYLLHIIALSFVVVFSDGSISERDRLQGLMIPPQLAHPVAFMNAVLFCLIVILDGGLGGFLAGKYGPPPGGSMYLYTLYTSSLFCASVLYVFSAGREKWLEFFFAMQLILLFLSGDRTILFMVIFTALLKKFWGRRIYSLISVRALVFFVPLLAFLILAKSIYALFAAGMLQTFDFVTLLEAGVSQSEFFHNFSFMRRVVDMNVSYSFEEYFIELLAGIPGSSVLGVDPHGFSNKVKREVFQSWGFASGVGNNIFAIHYATFGQAGPFVFSLIFSFVVFMMNNFSGRNTNKVLSCLILVVLTPLTFYIYRNGVGQILSFTVRYMVVVLISLSMSFYLRSLRD